MACGLQVRCCNLDRLFFTQLGPASHSFLLLCPCVEQHRLSSQAGFHSSLRNHVLVPVISSLRVHRPQLQVAVSYAVQTPQLVAQAFTLLSQDVNLFDCCATVRTRTAAVSGEGEPGQSGIRLGLLFAQAALLQTEENTWNETDMIRFSHQLDQAHFSNLPFSVNSVS